MDETSIDHPAVTRVEVIDQTGRLLVKHHLTDVALSFQDDGRTLKVFCRSLLRYPLTLDVDDDGYPDEQRLDEVRYATDMHSAALWLVLTVPGLIESMPCGSVSVTDGEDHGDPIKVINISTGGWSGQESFLNALERSAVGRFFLYSWRRGGHYEFRVPLTQLRQRTGE